MISRMTSNRLIIFSWEDVLDKSEDIKQWDKNEIGIFIEYKERQNKKYCMCGVASKGAFEKRAINAIVLFYSCFTNVILVLMNDKMT